MASFPSSHPPVQIIEGYSPMKYEKFQPQDHIPFHVLEKIKNRDEAKNVGFFFYERGEQITEVTIDRGFLNKIFTVQGSIKRIWAKKQGDHPRFTLMAEMKILPPSQPKIPAISKCSIDEID